MSLGLTMARAADSARDKRHERLKSIAERLRRLAHLMPAELAGWDNQLDTLSRELDALVAEGP